LSFTTQNKPIEDDNEPFNSLSFVAIEEKKMEDDDEMHLFLSFALVS